MRRSTSCTRLALGTVAAPVPGTVVVTGGAVVGTGVATGATGRGRGRRDRRGRASRGGVVGRRGRRRAGDRGGHGLAVDGRRERGGRRPGRGERAGHHAAVGHDLASRARSAACMRRAARARIGRRAGRAGSGVSPAGGSIMLASAAAVADASPERHLGDRACSVEFWRSSVLWVWTAREMPEFSRSSETCMATIPPSMMPDHPDAQRGCAAGGRRRGGRGSGASRSNGAGAAARGGAPARQRPARTGRRPGAGASGAVRGRVAVACSGMSALLPELACGPEASRLRTGVGRDLARRGDDRAAVDELRLRRVAADADGQVGRADAAARASRRGSA